MSSLLDDAEAFHSHLGPFLVLGLKAGLFALSELNTKRGDPKLNVHAQLPYRVPISCLLDGVQFSTACTIGNKRLSFKDSTDMILTFNRNEKTIRLTLKKTSFELLSRLFHGEHLSEKELKDIGHNLVNMNEKALLQCEAIPPD